MQLKWEGGAGSIEINGTEYVLLQCHWHSPSEHTIHGKRYLILNIFFNYPLSPIHNNCSTAQADRLSIGYL